MLYFGMLFFLVEFENSEEKKCCGVFFEYSYKEKGQQLTLKNANLMVHFFWFNQNFNDQIEII